MTGTEPSMTVLMDSVYGRAVGGGRQVSMILTTRGTATSYPERYPPESDRPTLRVSDAVRAPREDFRNLDAYEYGLRELDGQGMVAVDYDNNGSLEVLTNNYAQNVTVYDNQGKTGNSLQVLVKGGHERRTAERWCIASTAERISFLRSRFDDTLDWGMPTRWITRSGGRMERPGRSWMWTPSNASSSRSRDSTWSRPSRSRF